jgi:hypothetical protein
VSEDIQKISSRSVELKEKLRHQPELHQERIRGAELESQRALKRASRQLEADERQAWEKLATAKAESMQKIAAETIGPRLEQVRAPTETRGETREKRLTWH